MFERDKKTGLFAVDAHGHYKPKTSHTKRPVPLALYDPHGLVPEWPLERLTVARDSQCSSYGPRIAWFQSARRLHA